MKYKEFHKWVKANGWVKERVESSHFLYKKDGKLSPPVPFHGGKEMGEGLRKRLIKQMGLK